MNDTSHSAAISAVSRALCLAQETLDSTLNQLHHLQALFEIIDHLSDEVQFVSHLSLIGQSYADRCALVMVRPIAQGNRSDACGASG